jgi:hypothetical protein
MFDYSEACFKTEDLIYEDCLYSYIWDIDSSNQDKEKVSQDKEKVSQDKEKDTDKKE